MIVAFSRLFCEIGVKWASANSLDWSVAPIGHSFLGSPTFVNGMDGKHVIQSKTFVFRFLRDSKDVVLDKHTAGKRATVLFDLYFTHDYKLGPLNHSSAGNVAVSVLGSNFSTRKNHVPQVYFCQFTSKWFPDFKAITRRLLMLAKHRPTTWSDCCIFFVTDTLDFELTVFIKFVFPLSLFPR